MLLFLTVITLGSIILIVRRTSVWASKSYASQKSSVTSSKYTSDEVIKVYLRGAVKNPGPYTIEKGRRVFDLLRVGGGITEDAQVADLNLAAPLEDRTIVEVHFKEGFEFNSLEEQPILSEFTLKEIYAIDPQEGKKLSKAKTTPISKGEKININTAERDELQKLPQIGPTTAGNVIKFREQNGLFGKIEDIMKVKGIGEKTFQKIKDYLTVGVVDASELESPSSTDATYESVPATGTTTITASEPGKIDINTATVDQLSSLHRIGNAIAQRIMKYREENGPFKEIEDIMKVRGIGKKTFERIKHLITVEE